MCTAIMRCDLFNRVRWLWLTNWWYFHPPVCVDDGVPVTWIQLSCLNLTIVWISPVCSQMLWGRVWLQSSFMYINAVSEAADRLLATHSIKIALSTHLFIWEFAAQVNLNQTPYSNNNAFSNSLTVPYENDQMIVITKSRTIRQWCNHIRTPAHLVFNLRLCQHYNREYSKSLMNKKANLRQTIISSKNHKLWCPLNLDQRIKNKSCENSYNIPLRMLIQLALYSPLNCPFAS